MTTRSSFARKATTTTIIVLAVALLISGLIWERHRTNNPPSSEDNTATSTSKPALIQPESYYRDPWVYFLGDGYADVMNNGRAETPLWPALVAQERQWYPILAGVQGSGYVVNGRNGSSFLGQVERTKLRDANGVVISGGISDVLSGAPPEEIRQRVSQTFTRIRSYAPRVPVTVMSVEPSSVASPERTATVDQILQSEATKINAKFAQTAPFQTTNTTSTVPGSPPGQAEAASVVGIQLEDPTAKTR